MKTLACLALVVSLAVIFAPACSLGQGVGCISGTLDVQDCWSGPFDLHPDFFAAVPSNSAALQIRIQHGIDFATFSDGLLILVDDVGLVRGSSLGQPLIVGLPPAVTPPGVPVMAVANPPLVHATLYLERTCPTQTVALYAMDAVTLEPDGTCNRPDSGVEAPLQCDTDAMAPDAGAVTGVDASAATSSDAAPSSTNACTDFQSTAVSTNVATSMIQFTALFDGNEAESNAAQRRTVADFDFYLADPRETCPGGLGPPPRCRAHLKGRFDFYFERGRPAQPFP